jgi:uncharacterized protein
VGPSRPRYMSDLGFISPLSVLSGFVVGLLIGLTGVGGGSLMTPLLILLFGTEPTIAVGTDLFYAAATKSVGGLTHSLRKTVDWRITGLLGAGSMPGSIMTITALYLMGITGGKSPRLVTLTLAVALILSAASVMARPLIRRMSHRHAGERRRWTAPSTVLLGFVLGVLVTITSVGAGALGMTLLVILYPGVRLVRLVGSDNRACGAADPNRRSRALAARFGGLAADGLATARLGARDHDRQPHEFPPS